MNKKDKQKAVDGLSKGKIEQRTCKLSSCSVKFIPSRKDKRFHTNACKDNYWKYHRDQAKVLADKKERKKPNHHAKLANSKILQKTLKALKKRKWSSTLEISLETESQCVGSDISALRTNGYDVECKYFGRSKDKRRLYKYKLKGKAA